jgi:hypothetical protein
VFAVVVLQLETLRVVVAPAGVLEVAIPRLAVQEGWVD